MPETIHRSAAVELPEVGDGGTTTALAGGSRWIQLTEENLELGRRYIEIMCQMDRENYETDRVEKICLKMAHKPCEYYLCQGPGFEIALGFRWMRKRKKYQLVSVGFVGQLSPREALDLVVTKFLDFMQERGVEQIFAVRPLMMESPRIMRFHHLVPTHPRLKVRGGHRVTGGIFWQIGPAES